MDNTPNSAIIYPWDTYPVKCPDCGGSNPFGFNPPEECVWCFGIIIFPDDATALYKTAFGINFLYSVSGLQ